MVAEAGCSGKTAESDGGPQVIAGERNRQQEMVLHSHVWGKFQKGTDRVVNTVGPSACVLIVRQLLKIDWTG